MRTIMIIVQEGIGAPAGRGSRAGAGSGSGPGPAVPARRARGPSAHGGDAHAAPGVAVADGVDGGARVTPGKTCGRVGSSRVLK